MPMQRSWLPTAYWKNWNYYTGMYDCQNIDILQSEKVAQNSRLLNATTISKHAEYCNQLNIIPRVVTSHPALRICTSNGPQFNVPHCQCILQHLNWEESTVITVWWFLKQNSQYFERENEIARFIQRGLR
jgi:hypothetical protein